MFPVSDITFLLEGRGGRRGGERGGGGREGRKEEGGEESEVGRRGGGEEGRRKNPSQALCATLAFLCRTLSQLVSLKNANSFSSSELVGKK